MKYLSDYSKDGITDLLNKLGGFYAFSDAQYNEVKREGVEYVSLGMGLICPKENAKALQEGLIEVSKNAIQQDLKENGKENIIKRELSNHEAYYTGEISDTYGALVAYGITEAEIYEVYRKELPNHYND